MKLKLDQNGNAVITDGKPIYVYDDGKEAPIDVAATVQTITRLNGEAKSHRERAEAAEGKLKGYEGLDPEASRKALDTLKNIDDKKLVDAGKVEEVRAAAVKAYEEKLVEANRTHSQQSKELQTMLDKATNDLYAEKIGGSFTRSKLIAEKFAIPADIVQARFGSAFKIENGSMVAYDNAGNKIYSRERAGELANFDEALETLVGQYPYKDQILKGSGASGSGAQQSAAGAGGKRIVTREQFFKMDAATQRATATDKNTTLID